MLKFLLLKTFRKRKFTSFLSIVSIGLSLSLFLMVNKTRKGVEDSFTNAISNADLIVGARSGNLQLLLYSIFHMGSPTKNITIESYNTFKNHPTVAWTIPISLGDSYKGFRVVGTDHNFLKHYQFYGNKNLKLKSGQWMNKNFDVVLGSQVAKKFRHNLHDKIILSHGIAETSLLDHENTPFAVSGILSPTGTPIDKSVYITLGGIEAMHGGSADDEPSQLTAFILRTKNRIALLGLRRYISGFQSEALSAIIPGLALSQLWKLLDNIENAFLAVSIFVIIIGFLTILIVLYMSLNERKDEIKILRSLGASAKDITLLLILEASILSSFGAFLGFSIQYIITALAKPFLEANYGLYIKMSLPNSQELLTILIFVICGTIFGLIPAIRAYKRAT